MSRAVAVACPFCGGNQIAVHPYDIAPTGASLPVPGDVHYAHCDGCGAEGPQAETVAGALDLWNRRASGHDAQLRKALADAAAHLAAAASAYRRHAARHRSVGRAVADPLFTTRAADFDAAAGRVRAVLAGTAEPPKRLVMDEFWLLARAMGQPDDAPQPPAAPGAPDGEAP